MDKDGEKIESAADGVTISTDAAAFNEANSLKETDWAAVVEDLPKYDEGGHLYHYLVLEDSSFDEAGHVPTFENAYYPGTGDYSSVVINAPGEGIRIMVQKNWIDDGDELHREPVTLQAYYKGVNEPAAIDEPITVTDEDGTWVEFITSRCRRKKMKKLTCVRSTWWRPRWAITASNTVLAKTASPLSRTGKPASIPPVTARSVTSSRSPRTTTAIR